MPVLRLLIRINRTIGIGFSLAIVLPLGVLTWEVAMRYGFGAPTIWAHLTATGLIAAIFIFGGVLADQDGEHVGLAVHERLVPERLQPLRRAVVDVIVLGFLGVLAWALILQAYRSVLVWETAGLAWRAPVPMLIKLAMAAGVTLFAIDLAARLALRLIRPRRQANRP